MTRAFVPKAAASLVALLIGCGQPDTPSQDLSQPQHIRSAKSAASADPLVPRLPKTTARFWPALVAAPADLGGASLSEPQRCSPCHAEIVAAWQASAHAFASFNNPIYRASVETLREARPLSTSRACAACHDPALLIDDAMSATIDPRDPRAHAGVSCGTCHGIVKASADGNGSYQLGRTPIPIPQSDTPAERKRHRLAARTSALSQAELCASCHRAFLGADSGNAQFFAGADDFGPWARSAFAGSHGQQLDHVDAKSCTDCHMPRVRSRDPAAKTGRVASHFFPGGHTWLQAMRGDAARQAEVERLLAGAVRLDVAAVTLGDQRAFLPELDLALEGGQPVILDLVVENLRVGHHFPGGVRDVQDTWLEVRVASKDGKWVATSGAEHERREERDAHSLRAAILDGSGAEVRAHATHQFQSVAFDHTLGPREARVVRFAFVMPDAAKVPGPLTVTASLRHRSRDRAMQAAACRESTGARGRAYAAVERSAGRRALDPCGPQPITVIATAQALLAAPHVPRTDPNAAARLYAYGRALLSDVQEQLPTALAALQAALRAADREGNTQVAAQTRLALASLFARQGRTDDALAELTKLPDPAHPAAQRVRGQALAQVWRFDEALVPFEVAARAAPRDDGVWAQLAIALGSVGKHQQALSASRMGLLSAPRNEALLRVQALSLAGLEAGSGADAASRAYLSHRETDAAASQRRACEQTSADCARERRPVHVHEMR